MARWRSLRPAASISGMVVTPTVRRSGTTAVAPRSWSIILWLRGGPALPSPKTMKSQNGGVSSSTQSGRAWSCKADASRRLGTQGRSGRRGRRFCLSVTVRQEFPQSTNPDRSSRLVVELDHGYSGRPGRWRDRETRVLDDASGVILVKIETRAVEDARRASEERAKVEREVHWRAARDSRHANGSAGHPGAHGDHARLREQDGVIATSRWTSGLWAGPRHRARLTADCHGSPRPEDGECPCPSMINTCAMSSKST
jgi:hypothetical protein